MILLASEVDAGTFGGVPLVNRLVRAAADAHGLPLEVVALNDPPGAAWLRGRRGRAAGGSRLGFALRALLARAHPRSGPRGTVLVTHAALAPVGRLIAPRGRLVVFLHGVEAWRPLPARTRWGLRAARLLANSALTLERFGRANPSLAGLPAEVCPLPARDLGPPVPRTDARPRVLVVGRLWGRGLEKGQDRLIDAWPRVLARHPAAELLVVGDGDGRAALEARARARGVGAAVRFAGAVEDRALGGCYDQADVYAMPSKGEGFGLVFAEAMARGLPCVASRLDGGAQVVVDGETGLLVDPDDPDALAGALLRLLDDPALRARLGEAGRRRARDLHSEAAFRERIVRALRGEG